jgi:hypothetical protein
LPAIRGPTWATTLSIPLESLPIEDLASLHGDQRLGAKTGNLVPEPQSLVPFCNDVRPAVANAALDLEEVGEVGIAAEAELEPSGLGARVEQRDLLQQAAADEAEPSDRERVRP